MPRLHHYDNLGTARFLTFVCYRNLPFLQYESAKQILVEEIDSARQKHRFRLLSYVLMPEHAHLVIHPPEGMSVGRVIGEIKSKTARRFFAAEQSSPPGATRVFWQKRCYDHNCRTHESTIEKIRYCHNNPVRRGLVAEPGDWTWSSYNCYHGVDDVPLLVDRIEL